MMILEPWSTNPEGLIPDPQTLLNFIGELLIEEIGLGDADEDLFDLVVTRLSYLRAHKNGTTPKEECAKLNKDQPDFHEMCIELENCFPPFEGFVSEVKEITADEEDDGDAA
jgi:hypothetical protein